MKKWLSFMVFVFILGGCTEKELVEKSTLPEGVPNVEWFQNDDSDYKLFLSEDGTVSYYSPGAGSPYHNFDLCENYTYNEKNKTFLFNSNSCTMKFIRISEDKTELELLVDGERIMFKKTDESIWKRMIFIVLFTVPRFVQTTE